MTWEGSPRGVRYAAALQAMRQATQSGVVIHANRAVTPGAPRGPQCDTASCDGANGEEIKASPNRLGSKVKGRLFGRCPGLEKARILGESLEHGMEKEATYQG